MQSHREVPEVRRRSAGRAPPMRRRRSRAAAAARDPARCLRRRPARQRRRSLSGVPGDDFYIRKDFDPKLGLTVVIIGALISAVFYWFGRISSPTASSAAPRSSIWSSTGG